MRRKTTVGEVDADVLAYTAGQDRVLDLALVEADCFGTAAHVAMLSPACRSGRRFFPRRMRGP